jgi:DegV family protein with EDD domain
VLEAVAARTTLVLVVSTLENLVRGGRAGFLRAWLADALDLKPVISFVDGNLKGVGRISGKADRVVELTNAVGRTMLQPKKVWVGISHGGAPQDALRLEEHVRRTFPVEYVYRQRLSASIYLHVGPGALCLAVTQLDGLAWTPTPPPLFSEKV